VRTLITTIVATPIMTYALLPWMTRRFEWFLKATGLTSTESGKGVGDPCARRKEAPMPKAWSAKRERQYEHIKEGLEERGRNEDTAEEIAARTVNKERARSGEAKQKSKTSTDDISSGRRGGLRSHRGSGGRTKAQLYEEAKKKNIEGRSQMTKDELEKAVGR
jgi:hypothetical protein